MRSSSEIRSTSVIALVAAVMAGIAVGSGEAQRVLILLAVLCVAAVSVRWPLVALCGAIAAIPLEVAGRLLPGVEEITLAKALLLVAAASWILRLMLTREQIRLPRNAWALFGFWLAALLGTLLGPYGTTLEGAASLVALTGQLVMVLMVFNLVRTQRDLQLVLAAVLIGCALVSAVGMLDIVTGSSFLKTVDHQFFADGASGLKRITATFYDPNALGRFLTFGILINLTVLSATGSGRMWQRLALVGLLGAQCVCLIYTFSRGALIAVIGGVLVFVLTGRGSWKVRVFSVATALVSGSLLFTSQIGALFGRFAVVDVGLGGRLTAVRAAIAAFLRRPLLGYGPGNASRAIGAEYGAPLAAHNLYTEILVSSGAVGGFLLAMFVGSLLGDTWRVRDVRLMPYVRGVTATFVGVLLIGLSLHTLKANELWLSMAILACTVRIASSTQEPVPVHGRLRPDRVADSPGSALA